MKNSLLIQKIINLNQENIFRVHKYILFDKESNMFKTKDGILIDTKEKHYNLIMNVFSINNSNYEIESFNFNKD